MSPNPTALRHLVKEEEVDAHRCVSCSEYDDCLDAALRLHWRSWSCGQCSIFAHARDLPGVESPREWPLRSVA